MENEVTDLESPLKLPTEAPKPMGLMSILSKQLSGGEGDLKSPGGETPYDSDLEEGMEEKIKIVLTNDEIDPEDEQEKDPRKMLSK